MSSMSARTSSFYVADEEDEDEPFNSTDLIQQQQSGFQEVISEKEVENRSTSYSPYYWDPSNVLEIDEDAIDDKVGPNDFIDCGIVGTGKYATVKRVFHKNIPNKLYAMKIICKKNLTILDRYRAKSERAILCTIRYPFIVRLYNAFQTCENLVLVMEYGHGGDLRCALNTQPNVPIFEAKLLISEISLAIEYIHSIKVCFRDLKPANIVLDKDGYAKLTDFGMCKIRNEQTRAFSTCGTIKYMSPQAIKRSDFHNPGDWWSVGVISYELLMGHHPFSTVFPAYTPKMIVSGNLAVTLDVNIPYQDFLSRILNVDQDSRLCTREGAQEVFDHPFFSDIDTNDLIHRRYKPTYNPNLNQFSYLNPDANYAPVDVGTPYTENQAKNIDGDLHTNQNFLGYEFNSKTTPINRKELQMVENGSMLDTIPFKVTDCRGECSLSVIVGRGRYSVVYKAYYRPRSCHVALKLVMKCHKNCMDEIRILVKLGSHPNIVAIRDVYINPTHMVIALEFISGLDLRSYLLKRTSISEKTASELISVLCQAVQYLHTNNVIHRDISLDNIRFYDENERIQSIKLMDFSFASILQAPSRTCIEPCASVNNAAPEVLAGDRYSYPCDIWSMGIVLFTILSGSTPFDFPVDMNKKCVLNCVSNYQLDLSDGIWSSYSQDAKDILKCMMITNAGDRINCSRISRHPWLINNELQHSANFVAVDYSSLKDKAVIMFDTQQSDINMSTVDEKTLIENRERSSPSLDLM